MKPQPVGTVLMSVCMKKTDCFVVLQVNLIIIVQARFCPMTYFALLDHLTSFSLLLRANLNTDPCGTTSSYGYFIAWLSLGVIVVGFFIVLVAIIIIELYERRRKQESNRVRGRISQKKNTQST